jgi:hypothetical protein
VLRGAAQRLWTLHARGQKSLREPYRPGPAAELTAAIAATPTSAGGIW